jgi:hypothetical protein
MKNIPQSEGCQSPWRKTSSELVEGVRLGEAVRTCLLGRNLFG